MSLSYKKTYSVAVRGPCSSERAGAGTGSSQPASHGQQHLQGRRLLCASGQGRRSLCYVPGAAGWGARPFLVLCPPEGHYRLAGHHGIQLREVHARLQCARLRDLQRLLPAGGHWRRGTIHFFNSELHIRVSYFQNLHRCWFNPT